MRGGRILWGQIAVVFTIALVMTWVATQWTAWRLGFQAQLGNPWFELAGWPIYYPPAFFWWWFSFDAYAPAIFTEGGFIAVSGGFIAIIAAITMSVIRARESRNVATYGSARWAENREIRAAGLLGPDGVVLGRFERDYLRHDGPEHVLCFAPTRSGKGVGLVVPTLLTWPGSCIVHDIKGENWTLIRATKARYYEDARFKERILTPPDPAARPSAAQQGSDDWSRRVVTVAKVSAESAAAGSADGDPANAGIRREPELPEHEEIVAPPRPPEQEFDLLDDEPDIDAAKARALRSHIRLVARQASLDPGDGIEL